MIPSEIRLRHLTTAQYYSCTSPERRKKDRGPGLKAILICGSFMGLKAHAPSVRL
jgi:hypothetical protein